MGAGETENLTIDELAAQTGLSVRNIRSHVSRGLLPAPELRGRTAYYDQRHVDRLELITSLQAEGLTLAVIGRLIRSAEPASSPAATGFYHSVLTSWMAEPAREMTAEELHDTVGAPLSDRLRKRLVAAGFVEVSPGGSAALVPNPPLLRALGEAVRAGVAIDDVIEVQLGMIAHVDAIAELFVEVFSKTLHRRFPNGAPTAAELEAMRRLVDELRPHASTAVLAAFHEAMVLSMRDAVEGLVRPRPD